MKYQSCDDFGFVSNSFNSVWKSSRGRSSSRKAPASAARRPGNPCVPPAATARPLRPRRTSPSRQPCRWWGSRSRRGSREEQVGFRSGVGGQRFRQSRRIRCLVRHRVQPLRPSHCRFAQAMVCLRRDLVGEFASALVASQTPTAILPLHLAPDPSNSRPDSPLG